MNKILNLVLSSIFLLMPYFFFNKLIFILGLYVLLIVIFNKKSKFFVPFISMFYISFFYIFFELGNLFFKTPQIFTLFILLFMNIYFYLTNKKYYSFPLFLNSFIIYFFIAESILTFKHLFYIALFLLMLTSYLIVLNQSQKEKHFFLNKENSFFDYKFLVLYLCSLFLPFYLKINITNLYIILITLLTLSFIFNHLLKTKLARYFKILFLLLCFLLLFKNIYSLFFILSIILSQYISLNSYTRIIKKIKANLILIPKLTIKKSYFNTSKYILIKIKLFLIRFEYYEYKAFIVLIILTIIVSKFLFIKDIT